MLRTMTDHEVIPYLREVCGLPWSEQEIMDKIIARMEDFYSTAVRPKPGLEKFLSILKMEGVWMYVATATHRRPDGKSPENGGHRPLFPGHRHLRRRRKPQVGKRRNLRDGPAAASVQQAGHRGF